MVDDVPLRTAVDKAWAVYLAKHRGVDAADSRRCLLERHLQSRREAREGVVEELTGFGTRGGMLKRMEGFVCRVAAESTGPDRTLLAISYLASATVVVVLRSVFGLSG